MKKIFLFGLFICIMFLFGSCVDFGGGGSSGLSAKFITTTTNLAKNSSKSVIDQKEEISGLFIQSMHITLFQHKPGIVSSYDVRDWVEYRLINNTVRPNRWNHVLRNGETLDLIEMNGGETVQEQIFFLDSITADFIELNLSPGSLGIIFNDEFWAYDTLAYYNRHFGVDPIESSLHRYPDLANIPYHNLGEWDYTVMANAQWGEEPRMKIENVPLVASSSIVFARSDWFPEPTYVIFEYVVNEIEDKLEKHLYDSSIVLSDWQINLLSSLIDHLHTNISIHKGFMLIPYDGPLVWSINGLGQGVSNPEFSFSFDFTNLLTEETYESIINDDPEDVQIVYRLINNIPYGLNFTFKDLSR